MKEKRIQFWLWCRIQFAYQRRDLAYQWFLGKGNWVDGNGSVKDYYPRACSWEGDLEIPTESSFNTHSLQACNGIFCNRDTGEALKPMCTDTIYRQMEEMSHDHFRLYVNFNLSHEDGFKTHLCGVKSVLRHLQIWESFWFKMFKCWMINACGLMTGLPWQTQAILQTGYLRAADDFPDAEGEGRLSGKGKPSQLTNAFWVQSICSDPTSLCLPSKSPVDKYFRSDDTEWSHHSLLTLLYTLHTLIPVDISIVSFLAL